MSQEILNNITRDERQAESVRKWITSKGRGTLECCTGFKTEAVLQRNLQNYYRAISVKVQ